MAPDTPEGGFARDTEITESDPSGDSPEGLAGGMGVSSERRGPARGEEGEVTYGTEDPTASAADSALPEQSADGEEVHPDQPPLKDHRGRLHGGDNRPRSGE